MKKFNLKFIALTVLSIFLLSNSAIANDVNLFTNVVVYVDSSNSKKIVDVSKKDFQHYFNDFTEEIRNQSFTNYTYWIKLKITTNNNQYLISKNVFIDQLTLYTPVKNGWNINKAGLLKINKNRTGHSVISIPIPEKSLGKTCYIAVQSDCISMLDLWLVDEIELIQQENFKILFYLIFIFIILGYFFAVLFLYFTSKQKGLLILAFYALSSILMILFTNGYLYQWLPELPLVFYKWSFVYVVDIYWGAAVLLSFYLFKVDTYSKRITSIYYAAFAFLFIMLFSPLVLDRQLVTKIHFIIPTLFILFNTITGFYLFFKKKVKSAIFLSIGWLIYFVLLSVWSMSKMGAIQKSFFTDNAPAFGLILEFLIFAIIGGLHYFKKQKETEQLRNKLSSIDSQNAIIIEQYGDAFQSLSAREKEVLTLIAQGLLDKEIANELELSLPSIRTYSKRIYDKLKVSNRTEAANIYNKLKLIQFI